MNATQPKTRPTYGYDGICASFQVIGKPFLSYDASANWFTAFNLHASAGTTPNFQQFTGKERDAESGLDYFGARYYGSALGRFTSPDWSATPRAVPYADLSNPQSLNLYIYMRNNPLGGADADGHDGFGDFFSGFADTTYRPIVQAVSHPLDTGAALVSAATHPVQTAVAVKDAVVATTTAALSGDPKALGQVTGTIVSTIATAGAAKLAGAVVEGAEVASDTAKLLGQANEARDALAVEVGASKATVTAGYNSTTGEVAARACGGGLCAEDHVNQAVGGADGFTKAVRPRTGREVPVCELYEASDGRDKFPPGTKFKSDQQ